MLRAFTPVPMGKWLRYRDCLYKTITLFEMERDCMLAHGASAFTQERLLKVSDDFKAPVCTNPDCGIIAASTEQCHSCDHDEIVDTVMPYATKLLIQECNAMGLKMVIHPKK